MSVSTFPSMTMHGFECQGPPPFSSIKQPLTLASALTSIVATSEEADRNVHHIFISRPDGCSIPRGQNDHAPTADVLEYELEDGIDRLMLVSDDDDDDGGELGAHGAGGTKRSSSKSCKTRDDSDTTMPKKRHQSSCQEPCSPPVALPVNRDGPPPSTLTTSRFDTMTMLNQPQAAAGMQVETSTPEGASGGHQQLTRPTTFPSPSSNWKGAAQTRLRVGGSREGLDTPVQDSGCPLRGTESLLADETALGQGSEPARQTGRSLSYSSCQTANASVQGPPPSVGISPSRNEDLASDVDPDGMAGYCEEQNWSILRIVKDLEAVESTRLADFELGRMWSQADEVLQMEDWWRASGTSVPSTHGMLSTFSASQTLPGVDTLLRSSTSISGEHSMGQLASVCTWPPVSAFSYDSRANTPSLVGSGYGPPQNSAESSHIRPSTSGPSRTSSGARSRRAVCAKASNSTCTVSDAGSSSTFGLHHASTSRLPDDTGLVSGPAEAFCPSSAPLADLGETSSSSRRHRTSCHSSAAGMTSHRLTLIQRQQTGMSSGGSITGFEKAQRGISKSQRTFSSERSCLPHVKDRNPTFSKNLRSSTVIKERWQPDQNSAWSELCSSPGHPWLPFPVVNMGSSSTGTAGCGTQLSSEPSNQSKTFAKAGSEGCIHSLIPVGIFSECEPVHASSNLPHQSVSGADSEVPNRPVSSTSLSLPSQAFSGQRHTNVTPQLSPSSFSSSRNSKAKNGSRLQPSATIVSTDDSSAVEVLTSPSSGSKGSTPGLSDHHRLSISQLSQPVPSNVHNDHTDSRPPPAYPVPVFVGRVPELRDEKEAVNGRSEGGCMGNGAVTEEVLRAVCDANGVWRTDSAHETFLHWLSGWEIEQAAVDAVYLVGDKPNFQQALNQYSKNSETPLYSAVCLGKRDLVEAMLHHGANVNSRCCFETQGQTTLHKAVENGDARMVSVLLKSPFIDINMRRCSDGCTPLMVSLLKHVAGHPTQDHFDIITMMVEEEDKPHFNAVDHRSSKTAFMMAVETKDPRVVRLILEEVEADDARRLANMQNRAGNSAMHLAAGLRNVEDAIKKQILKMLIMAGGDTSLINKERESPNDWAGGLIREIQSELT